MPAAASFSLGAPPSFKDVAGIVLIMSRVEVKLPALRRHAKLREERSGSRPTPATHGIQRHVAAPFTYTRTREIDDGAYTVWSFWLTPHP